MASVDVIFYKEVMYNMAMKQISEVLVVEGQNDINKIKSCLDCDVIKTNGTHISKQFIKELKEISKHREIIVMTDDDFPGRWIRTQIQEQLDVVKHAFIDKSQSSTTKKVGIEHASCESILKALENVSTFKNKQNSITFKEYQDCNLVLDYQKRNDLINRFNLPKMNSKRFFNVLNLMGITKEELL